jgi:decaprenyl-phosphate phosphoribosyltransferase
VPCVTRDTCGVEAKSARSVARSRGAVSRDTVRAAIGALRPKQYTKNLLLFAALLFADRGGSLEAWTAATTAFVAYCLASSASYLVNDVRDAREDRMHPVKRLRPIARGDLSAPTALVLAALLVAASLALAASLGADSLVYLLTFLAVQGLYSVVLKSVVLVDVAAIATLFVIRASAGAGAIDVPISRWLLVSTALLASFLALAKRRAELAVARMGRTPGRTSIRRYTVSGLDRLLAALAVTTVCVYTAYAALAHTPLLLVTVPLVAYGLVRYLSIVRHDGGGEEPENVLLTDMPLVATVATWGVLAGAIVAFA